MAPRTLTIQTPRDIDAEPRDVGAIALDQLRDALLEVLTILPETVVQVRSSYQTILLDEDPSLPASELALRWEESGAAGALARAEGALYIALDLYQSVREGVS